MRRRALASLALVSLALAPAAAPAAAGPPADGPSGFLCQMGAHLTDPTSPDGSPVVEVDAGPLVLVDDTVRAGTVYCDLYVGSLGTPYATFAASGTGVVVLPPTLVSYEAEPGTWISLCTRFAYAGGPMLYHHTDGDGDPSTDTGHWTTEPAGCDLSIGGGR
jgi:hypothetical protein